MKTAEIKVELLDYMGSDVSVVNAARVSFGKEVQTLEPKDIKLIGYLAEHGHWSPFAHTCMTLRIKVPLFLARQLVKHQVGGNWNEESRRYINDEPEFYFPEQLHYKPQNAKQGSAGVHDFGHIGLAYMSGISQQSLDVYRTILSNDVAPEEARMVLPLNTMTNVIWTGSVLFFARVFNQRIDGHAQLAAQEFARKLQDAVHDVYPVSWAVLTKDRKGK